MVGILQAVLDFDYPPLLFHLLNSIKKFVTKKYLNQTLLFS